MITNEIQAKNSHWNAFHCWCEFMSTSCGRKWGQAQNLANLWFLNETLEFAFLIMITSSTSLKYFVCGLLAVTSKINPNRASLHPLDHMRWRDFNLWRHRAAFRLIIDFIYWPRYQKCDEKARKILRLWKSSKSTVEFRECPGSKRRVCVW